MVHDRLNEYEPGPLLADPLSTSDGTQPGSGPLLASGKGQCTTVTEVVVGPRTVEGRVYKPERAVEGIVGESKYRRRTQK